jgi:hypothetical protein
MHQEERSGLGGEMWTRRRCGRGTEKHTWRTQEHCALDKGAFGEYRKSSSRIRHPEVHSENTAVNGAGKARTIQLGMSTVKLTREFQEGRGCI